MMLHRRYRRCCYVVESSIFHMSAQNIDCGYLLEPPRRSNEYHYSLEPPRQSGSNEYPKFMLLSRNKKNNVNPCKTEI